MCFTNLIISNDWNLHESYLVLLYGQLYEEVLAAVSVVCFYLRPSRSWVIYSDRAVVWYFIQSHGLEVALHMPSAHVSIGINVTVKSIGV